MVLKRITLFLIILLCNPVILFAQSTTPEKVTIYRGNITIQIDGEEAKPDDTTQPFILNDITYVPLRFVSKALQYRVDWDGTSRTVDIRSTGNETIAWGKTGLYKAFVSAEGTQLNEQITTEPVAWAANTGNDNYIIATALDADRYGVLKRITPEGQTKEVLLDISKFEALIGVGAYGIDTFSYKNGGIIFKSTKTVSASSTESYSYTLDIPTKKITVTNFSLPSFENLGAFNGDQEKYNALVQSRIAQQQALVNQLQ